MISVTVAFVPLLAALAWVFALIVDPASWDETSVFLIGFGLVLNGTVASVGIVIAGGRWAQRLALLVMAGTGVIAVARPVDALWVVAIALSALGVLALLTPPLVSHIRKLPSASGPPERSVLLTLAMLGVPLLVGLASWTGANWATLVAGLTAPLAAFAYARVLPAGYYLARFGWPVLAALLSIPQDMAAGIATVACAVAVFALGMDSSVRVAFYPPVERGSAYAIPPELAPREVLDAAQIDDKGRRR